MRPGFRISNIVGAPVKSERGLGEVRCDRLRLSLLTREGTFIKINTWDQHFGSTPGDGARHLSAKVVASLAFLAAFVRRRLRSSNPRSTRRGSASGLQPAALAITPDFVTFDAIGTVTTVCAGHDEPWSKRLLPGGLGGV